MDAVASRDAALEFLAAAAIAMVHLSRLAEELVLWSSAEFGFVELADAYATGSSLMPQKKNPDVPELVRGKTGRAIGNLVTLLTVMKGLPLTYNRDMQEDKEPVFDSAATLRDSLEVMAGALATLRVDVERMRRGRRRPACCWPPISPRLSCARASPSARPTRRWAGWSQHCVSKDLDLRSLSREDLRAFHPAFPAGAPQLLDLERALEARSACRAARRAPTWRRRSTRAEEEIRQAAGGARSGGERNETRARGRCSRWRAALAACGRVGPPVRPRPAPEPAPAVQPAAAADTRCAERADRGGGEARERIAFPRTDGWLHAEDVPVARIADEVGTPVYIYSASALAEAYDALDAGLRRRAPHDLLRDQGQHEPGRGAHAASRRGAGVDVTSGGELFRALRAGADPGRIVYSGVGKTDAEIDAALDAGIKMFNVESRAELRRIDARAGARGAVAPLAFRVNPDVDPQTHPYISTGLRTSKFGIPIGEAVEAYAEAKALEHVQVIGVDCHIGSQLMSVQPFADALARLRALVLELRDAATRIEVIDVGGGLGVTYADEQPPTRRRVPPRSCARRRRPRLRDRARARALAHGQRRGSS